MVVHTVQHAYYLLRHTDSVQQLPDLAPRYRVVRLFDIYESYNSLKSLSDAILLYAGQVENLLSTRFVFAETELCGGVVSSSYNMRLDDFSQSAVQEFQRDAQ